MIVRATRTHFDKNEYYNDEGLENLINLIGWENILQVLPCYAGQGEVYYTVIYKYDECNER